MNHHPLVDRDASCLAVIDVQRHFLDKLPLHERAGLVERIAWLMRVAGRLDIPILATAEDMNSSGPLVPELVRELPSGSRIHNKMIFGLHAQDDIRAAVETIGRRSFVLTGLETDVCITHSALGLRDAGYDVTVVEDACASPPPCHEYGLARLRDAGIRLTSLKGIFYEWVRTLAVYKERVGDLAAAPPAGVTL